MGESQSSLRLQFWQRSDHLDLAERAARRLSATPRPFLRWVGSKQAILKSIVPMIPRRFRTYREPFMGSGALFWLIEPDRAVLSDACNELTETFQAIRENAEAVIRHLKPMKPNKKLFYQIRANRSRGRFKQAAEFIYLNKTCWNGLYRVNANGDFNVPYGRPKTDFIADFGNLRACATALQPKGIRLRSLDFEEALGDTKSGDFVYLDPPYVTKHNNNGFIDYNENLFSWDDQVRLARCARHLARSGAKVIVSNANHKEVTDLYKGFEVVPVHRQSTLASDAKKRGRVSEALIVSI